MVRRRPSNPGGRDAGDAQEWARRAADAVAGFTSTRSKNMDAMFGGPGGPTHCLRAEGATVETADGRTLIDWTMALGAVALGYAHPDVAEAAALAAREGAVGPLPPTLEVRLAERLVAAYPGAEQAKFFLSGAEAVAAAVRVSRAATGREPVVYCGYHGWLDGPTGGAGVPAAARALWHEVPFDDVPGLERAVHVSHPAAIVLEPLIEREPSREWLDAARTLATRTGAALVLDEIKTAFRIARGGAAERFGVTPDLALLGKALANGFPLAALVGRADFMTRVRDTWISSTLATAWVALAAADAVLDVWEQLDVAGHIAWIGERAMAAASAACAGRRVRVAGVPAMWFLRFEDAALERRTLLGCAGRGVLLKRGPYNFPSLAHDEETVRVTAEALSTALAEAGA